MTRRMAVVLAAGKGTRMNSDLPKVLVSARNRPLIQYVIDALREARVDQIVVVVGYQADRVRATLADELNCQFVEQAEQLGTGHAVRMCAEQLSEHHGPVLIVTGDSPLTQATSIEALFADYEREPAACVLGTLHKPNPDGLGRIVRDASGQFQAIVEQKDADPEQQAITEVNMSTYLFDSQRLLDALSRIENDNRQGEYYLTDCPGIMKGQGLEVRALPILQPCEALSVNTLDDLAAVEAALKEMS